MSFEINKPEIDSTVKIINKAKEVIPEILSDINPNFVSQPLIDKYIDDLDSVFDNNEVAHYRNPNVGTLEVQKKYNLSIVAGYLAGLEMIKLFQLINNTSSDYISLEELINKLPEEIRFPVKREIESYVSQFHDDEDMKDGKPGIEIYKHCLMDASLKYYKEEFMQRMNESSNQIEK